MKHKFIILALEPVSYTHLICLSSGRGCTVMPSAPKSSQSSATFTTFGTSPPRALRSVATLFILKMCIRDSPCRQSHCLPLPYGERSPPHRLPELRPFSQPPSHNLSLIHICRSAVSLPNLQDHVVSSLLPLFQSRH